jgi:general secretion pathway protein D
MTVCSLRNAECGMRHVRWRRSATLVVGLSLAAARGTASAQEPVKERSDSVSVRLVDVELKAAIQALGRYVDRPVLLGSVPSVRVTVETPQPVPRPGVTRLLRGLVESQNLELVSDSATGTFRVRPREAVRPDAAATPPQPGALHRGGAIELFVIRLRHVRAADVAATVNALYGRASALGELTSGGRGGTLDESLRQNVVPPQTSGIAPLAPAGSVSSRPATLTGEVTIVPDPGSNSLLIRAGRTDFELIQTAVQQLDVRPLQVLIEVVIAEVRRDRSFAFGIDAKVPDIKVSSLDGARSSGTQTGLGLGDFVLRVLRTGSPVDFEATLRAAAARGDARILSRPIVLAANNEQAEILVGSQRPFVQVSRSLPTDVPSRDQVVQYKDVGTRLKVRPTISSDGYVAMAVVQEVNSATTETQFDAPVISTRTVDTKLLVRDSQTVVLGGLADKQRERTQGGVPILSSIPLLGGFFGRASQRSAETEFFLFITPRVIRTDDEADSLTRPLRQQSGQLYEP